MCTETIALATARTELLTSLTFDLANPTQFAGYTLSGVSLQFGGIAANSGTVSNTGTGGSVTGVGSSTVNFTFKTFDALNTALSSLSPFAVTVTSPSVGPFGPGTSGPFSGGPTTGLAAVLTGGSLPGLGFFSGPGTETVAVTTVTSQGVLYGGSGGQAASTINTVAAPEVIVDYTYTKTVTTVPEPMTAALFGSALFGLGFIRRRFS
jgi:hypothetical protein